MLYTYIRIICDLLKLFKLYSKVILINSYKKYKSICDKLFFDDMIDVKKEIMDKIYERYSEKWRVYHDSSHLIFVLNELLKVPQFIKNEIILALMYHDAVFIPGRTDNEFLSAQLAVQELKNFKFLNLKNIKQAVLDTRHEKLSNNHISNVVCDIDLLPLSIPPKKFLQNTKKVIAENNFIKDKNTRSKNILLDLINRSSIYATKYYRDKYENKARKNIINLLGIK